MNISQKETKIKEKTRFFSKKRSNQAQVEAIRKEKFCPNKTRIGGTWEKTNDKRTKGAKKATKKAGFKSHQSLQRRTICSFAKFAKESKSVLRNSSAATVFVSYAHSNTRYFQKTAPSAKIQWWTKKSTVTSHLTLRSKNLSEAFAVKRKGNVWGRRSESSKTTKKRKGKKDLIIG